MTKNSKEKTLLLVDGHSLAFRSFYAFSKGGEGGLQTSNGIPTSVTYGFLKSLHDNCKNLKPDGIAIAFDTGEPTFRHIEDPNYKANRDVAPEIFFEDLRQLQRILSEDLNITLCSVKGFEADDVLGTLAETNSISGWKVRILTGDRDLFQLVDDSKDIAVLYMGGGPYSKSGAPTLMDEEGVKNKLGVIPEKVIDLKALTGDSSDNIPGVKGVGPKTAINLLKENNDLDGIYLSLQELEKSGSDSQKGCIKGALKNKLKVDKDNAYLSKKLATIIVEVPLPDTPSFQLSSIDSEKFKHSLEELELTSLVRQISSFMKVFSDKETNKNIISTKKIKTDEDTNKSDRKNKIPNLNPIIVQTYDELNLLENKLLGLKDNNNPVALDTETTDLNPFKAELVGIGICWGENNNDIAYIPILHKEDNVILKNQLELNQVLNKLSPWLQSNDHPKVLQNTKFDRLILLRHGILIEGVITDTLLADYLIDPTSKHSLSEICERELDYIPKSFKDTLDKKDNFSEVSLHDASIYCGMDVYVTRKLSLILRDKLESIDKNLINILDEIEIPLEKVLANMENSGIKIDNEYLRHLSQEFKEKLLTLESNIFSSVGYEINLNSPKQLADLLFEKLNLDRKKSRKTKTGWSTDANVLEKLISDHPIIPQIVEHRTLNKLLSTYVDALPQLVELETQRVHTNFNQAVTATGRLSSSNPNLQNIPIRTEFSRRIRKAFLPKNDWHLMSADYSQIELRILAHLTKEELLIKAFKDGDDVHALTAKLLLGKQSINQEERRIGKTINFGVIYGMGPQRFARATGVSIDQAKEFLILYKERYPKVFDFLERQEKLALTQGFVSTILGRRRYFHFNENGLGRLFGKKLEEINLLQARRAGMEAQQLRAAANAPIQGSSADIIKIAMVKLDKRLREESLPANLLLQVHDELVLEFDTKFSNEIKTLVQQTMENSTKLDVPLKVDIGIGENWMNCK